MDSFSLNIRVVETIEELRDQFDLTHIGQLLEADLDRVGDDCDLNHRRRRDAEVLCTLAANARGNCLDLGTSHGRSAFRLATNLGERGKVVTVNLLPDQYSPGSGLLITHLPTKDEIGSYYRAHGLTNVRQIYADTASWAAPPEIGPLAIVYVDAAHDAERVYEDSRKFYERLHPGGFICWHDFSPEKRDQYDWIDSVMRGVERFVAETAPDAEVLHLRHSWTAVMRKPTSEVGAVKIRVGLAIDWELHRCNRWTTLVTSHLVNGILARFDCCLIQDQTDYENHLGDMQALISFEPGWGAPALSLRRTGSLSDKLRSIPSYMFYSDPHGKKWREDYALNGFDFVLAFYASPTRYHFRRLPPERLVHFPWAIPDGWIGRGPVVCRGQDQLTIFGAGEHEAYSTRNWCRHFPFVAAFDNSGCENKIMTEAEYLQWVASRDAVIAAGSEDPRYRLTTPKYFEIASMGALLFAQETDDLHGLGFRHQDNCIVFNRSNFEALASGYLSAPQDYLSIRIRGCELIWKRHALSVRLSFLEEHVRRSIEKKLSDAGLARAPSAATHEGQVVLTEPAFGEQIPTSAEPLTENPDADGVQTTSLAADPTVFAQPQALYLASADRMDRVIGNLGHLRREQLSDVGVYATVIGGLSGLNYLLALNPRRIVFYDINPAAIRYAQLVLELVRLSADPQGFISRFFGRPVDRFLEATGEGSLTVANQPLYLAQPVNEKLLDATLRSLSSESRRAYAEFVIPHLKAGTLDGVRNCRRLLPCWPPGERVPVGAGEAFGCDDSGRLVPNTNTFFYGHGWLASPVAFGRVKETLASVALDFVVCDLLHEESVIGEWLQGSSVVHVSNIDDWFPDRWPDLLSRWRSKALQRQCRLTVIRSQNGLVRFEADPHTWALAAVAPHVFGRTVEVTTRVPWGFEELSRTNVSVADYLQAPFPADTTLLHILLGEGISRDTFRAVYRKALEQSCRVIVLEHHRDSADWATDVRAGFPNEAEMRELISEPSKRPGFRIVQRLWLNGEKDDRRNLLFVLDTGNGLAPNFGPPHPLEAGTAAHRKREAKPRLLLMADVPNWIFARHCRMLERLLAGDFHFTIKMQGDRFREKDYDLIYPLEWNLIPREQINTPVKYVTGIRSHASWRHLEFFPFVDFLSTYFRKVHVVSVRLKRIFEPFLSSVINVTHGVDLEFFSPRTSAGRSGKGRLRVGWAGNRINATKGFDEYIKPLGKLPGVELSICGYLDRNLNLEEMRSFYDGIDAYVCASSLHHEGNNNSLLEAAAMQRAIITTDNGTVPEFLEDGHSALIVEPELPNFMHAVMRLCEDPDLRVQMGSAARQAVQRHFDWRQMALQYRDFFLSALDERDQCNAGHGLPRPASLQPSEAHAESVMDAQPAGPPNPNHRRVKGFSKDSTPGAGYSFCIITNGRRPHQLQRELDSIRRLNIPRHEIRIAGELPPGMPVEGFTYHPMPEAARSGKLGEMRNLLCSQARYENLVVADDDMVFHEDFYKGLLEFGNDYDILAVRLLNPDGTRFWDWATFTGPHGHRLLDYDCDDPNTYVTGGLCLIRVAVARSVRWNDQLAFYEKEDVDFSRRLREAGYTIRFCPRATVTHDDNRYTQLGDHILRLEESLEEGVTLAGFYPAESEGRRWMASIGSITISPSALREGGRVSFQMTCSKSNHYGSFPFNVSIMGRMQRLGAFRFECSGQTHRVALTLPRSSFATAIHLRSESVFIPQKAGINDDMRRLSVVFSDFKLTTSGAGRRSTVYPADYAWR